MKDRVDVPFLGQFQLVCLMADSLFDAKGSRELVRKLHAGAELPNMQSGQHDLLADLEVSGFMLLVIPLRLVLDGTTQAVPECRSYFQYDCCSVFGCGHLPSWNVVRDVAIKAGMVRVQREEWALPSGRMIRVVVCELCMTQHGRLVILLVRAVHAQVVL